MVWIKRFCGVRNMWLNCVKSVITEQKDERSDKRNLI